MYESLHQSPLSAAQFIRRVLLHLCLAAGLMVFSLGLGMLGYRLFEGLPMLDAFLNASMLLGGMGPVDVPHTAGGKLFAGLYALYAGLVFIVTAATIFTPLVHRLMHRLHWNVDDTAS